MTEKAEKKVTLTAAFKSHTRVWRLLWKRCPGRFAVSLLSSIVTALTPYATIWFSAQLVSELAGARNPARLVSDVIRILVVTGGLMLLNSLLTRWKAAEENDSLYWHWNRLLMSKLLDMDFVDADSQHVHDLYSLILQNTSIGRGIYPALDLFDALPSALFRILGGVGLTVTLFTSAGADGHLAFLNSPFAAGIVLVLMLGAALLSSFLDDLGEQGFAKHAADNRLGNRVFGMVGYYSNDQKRAPDMRIYRQQENILDKLLPRFDIFGPKSAFARLSRGRSGILIALSKCVAAVLTGFVYLFVCLKAYAGAFGLGAVTQYVGATTNLFTGIADMLGKLAELRANAVFLEPFFEILDTPNNMYQGSLTTEKRSDRQYDIEFRDVSFKYPGCESYALRHVNIRFRVGSRLAVVGMNGSGKTTFIKLLCRLYDPTEGQILLNGIDIRKYRYDDYISIFSVVFQDFQLLALPLGQNVASSVRYDARRVRDCLEKSGFSERLSRLPDGLDTSLYKKLDKDGVEVSGGEAQKIAIARTLYKDAPFLILDEPTAALDPIAEAEIYSKFDEIAGDKTAIYISHRLSSCKFCDEIAVFDGGQVVQQGTHETLAADVSGKYHELWTAQAQYYTEDAGQIG